MTTRFILIHTSHAGNVGAAARAMKVMGFDDLVLVRRAGPTCCARPEAIELAPAGPPTSSKAPASSRRWTRRWTA